MKYVLCSVMVCLLLMPAWAQKRRFNLCLVDSLKKPAPTDYFLVVNCDSTPCGRGGFQQCISSVIRLSQADKRLFQIQRNDSTVFCTVVKNPTEQVKNRYSLTDSCFFWGTSFRNADFEYLTFEREAIFLDVFFDNAARFFGAIFQKQAVFDRATFTGKATIDNPPFRFSGAEFQENVQFDRALFLSSVSFDYTTFKKEVSFNGARFDNSLYFRETTFEKRPDFMNVNLPDMIDFQVVKFKFPKSTNVDSLIDFRYATAERLRLRTGDSDAKCALWVDRASIGRMIVPYELFTIHFSDKITYDDKYSLFESLAKICQDAGLIESAENWDKEKRKVSNLAHFGPLGYALNGFNSLWWDFGYGKWRILVIWLPLFFLCFLAYNYVAIERLWSRMYQDTELGSNFRNKAGNGPKPIFRNRWKRFSFVFFYTAVIYFGFKIRHDSVNYNYTRGLLYLYLMYAVGTVHMAFALSYILSAY